MARRFYDVLSAPGFFDRVDEDQRVRLIRVLRHTSLRPFERDRALRGLLRGFDQNHDFMALQNGLEEFFVENDLFTDSADPRVIDEIRAEDLRLICFEVLH